MAKFTILADCRGFEGHEGENFKKGDIIELDEKNQADQAKIHDLAANGRITPPLTAEQEAAVKSAAAQAKSDAKDAKADAKK